MNLGLKAIRCIVFDDEGRKLAARSLPVHTELRSRAVEQDAREWTRLMREVVAPVAADAPHAIDTLTVTTSASCLVPVDASGDPTHPVLMVSDGRAWREAQALTDASDGSVAVSADLMLPKIAWLRDHAPEAFARTRYFLSAMDFLGLHLTGERLIDGPSATKFLASPDDDGSASWDAAWVERVGIDSDQLPAIAAPGTDVGALRETIVRDYGLAAGARLVLGTYDALSSVLGSGVCEPGMAAVVCGTVTSLRGLAPATCVASALPPPNGASAVPVGVQRMPWFERARDLALVGGSNNLGGGLIEWHKQAFYAGHPGEPYQVMDDEAAATEPGAEGMQFLPYLLGERAPVWDVHARGVFFGIDRRHTRAHFTRAVIESVAHSTRHLREHVEKAGCRIETLRFSGGLSRMASVRQVMADVLQVPVSIPTEFETTALGAHILAAHALGRFGDLREGCRAMVSVDRSYEPQADLAELYDAMFELYKRLYLDTRGLQAERVRILERFASALDARATRRENL